MMQFIILVVSCSLQASALKQSPPLISKQPLAGEQLFHVARPELGESHLPLVIECEATGEPIPRYYWQKDGKPFGWQYDDRILQQPGTGTLVILEPREEYSGQYQCLAANEWGTSISNSVFVRRARNLIKDDDPVTGFASATEGDSKKLSCEFSDGGQRPNIYWVTQNTSREIKTINDSRLTVDPEGNLWFSNVTKSDASDYFYYVCAAPSVFGDGYELGKRILFSVRSDEALTKKNKREPKRQYLSRRSEVALRGGNFELYCIYGGTPLPQIVWKKDDHFLHPGDRISQKNYGKTLVLKHVSFEDEGRYTCEASNGVGYPKSHSMNLRVLAVPFFTVEPQIIEAEEEETVEFRCEASGVPEPQIKWIRNAKPIEEAPANPRRRVRNNSIVIEKLERNDTGNYGCNATNALGYVYKDVYLNVLSSRPEIKHPPSNEETVDGQRVRMRCLVVGTPRPEVKWTKNGEELFGGRYTILESGDLEIENVNFLDAGTYTCHAFNKFGSAEASGNLIVNEHTDIIGKPEDCEVTAGADATFRCNVIADLTLKLTIQWLRDGKQIDFESESRFVKGADYSLTITNTTELDCGTYTCVARTELDGMRAQATLIVREV